MPPQQQPEGFDFHQTDDESVNSQTIGSRKRRVQICIEANCIRRIQHIKDMSKEDVKATWYEKEDYEGMKQTFIPIIRRMMKGEDIPETNDQTIRGLEFRTRDGAIRRQHNKLNALSAVLDEQDRQYNEQDFSDEKLAEVYQSFNAHCREAALKLGLEDEARIQDYYAEPCEDIDEIAASDLSRAVSAGFSCDPSDKKMKMLSKLFKQVRIRRRALLDDIKQLDHTRSMPQAA